MLPEDVAKAVAVEVRTCALTGDGTRARRGRWRRCRSRCWLRGWCRTYRDRQLIGQPASDAAERVCLHRYIVCAVWQRQRPLRSDDIDAIRVLARGAAIEDAVAGNVRIRRRIPREDDLTAGFESCWNEYERKQRH